MYQKFNTHSKALDNRIKAHGKYGSRDLNSWIFNSVKVAPGQVVMDLGCGRGKQTMDIAAKVGTKGHVTSVDLSKESLDHLLATALEKKLHNIETYHSDIDNIFKVHGLKRYDAMISSYALYYTHNPEQTIKNIYRKLKPGGKLFFCGPSKQNNAEIKNFHYKIKGGDIPPHTFASIFMEETGLQAVNKVFGKSKVLSFDNTLSFDSAEALYNYWSSYNLYDKSIDKAFKTAAAAHFKDNKNFITKKRVVGVLAVKPK